MNIKKFKNLSEEEQIKVLDENVFYFRFLENPSHNVRKFAIEKNSFIIFSIKDPTDEEKEIAILNSPIVLKYMEDPPISALIKIAGNVYLSSFSNIKETLFNGHEEELREVLKKRTRYFMLFKS